MSDIRRRTLASHVSYNLAAQVLHQLVPVLLVPLYTRRLSVTEFGSYAFALLAVSSLSAVLSSTISGTIGPAYVRSDGSRRRLILTATLGLGCVFGLAVTGMTLMLGAGLQVGGYADGLGVSELWPIATMSGPLLVMSFHTIVCRYADRTNRLVIVEGVYAATTIALVYLLVLRSELGLLGASMAIAVAHWLMVPLAIWNCRALLVRRLSRRALRSVAIRVGPLIPYTVMSMLRDNVDRMVLTGLAGPASAAPYFAVMTISRPVNVLVSAVAGGVAPEQMRSLRRVGVAGGSGIAGVLLAGFSAVVIVTVAVILLGRELVTFVLPVDYHKDWHLLPIFVLGYLFRYWWTLWQAVSFYHQRSSQLVTISSLAAVVAAVMAAMGAHLDALGLSALGFAAGHAVMAVGTLLAARGDGLRLGPELTKGITTLLVVSMGAAFLHTEPFGGQPRAVLIRGAAALVLCAVAVGIGWRALIAGRAQLKTPTAE